MQRQGVVPNAMTYNTIGYAYRKREQATLALDIFEAM